MSVEVITAPMLADARHGFLGRRGGVSNGVVAGLNCGLGSDDDRAAVVENRRRALAATVPGTALASLHQVHSALAVVAQPWPDADRPRADALVTDQPGLALGIVTADCAPVLFADIEHGVIGAAHAGWKGALGGVIAATVAAMETLGARREAIRTAVGPCIAKASYEVDDAFRTRFSADRFFAPSAREGHWQFDLEAFVLDRLIAAGVEAEGLRLDTYADPDRFYSFRRTTHRGEPDYGRQLSLIAL